MIARGYVYAAPIMHDGEYRLGLRFVPDGLPFQPYGRVVANLRVPLSAFLGEADFGSVVHLPRKGSCIEVAGRYDGYTQIGLRGDDYLLRLVPESVQIVRTKAARAEAKNYRVTAR